MDPNMSSDSTSKSASPAATAISSLALWDRIYALRRGWWIVLVCVVAATTAAVLKVRFSVPVYQAEAIVQRKQEQSPLAAVASRQTLGELLSEMELIRSTAVLGQVVASDARAASVTQLTQHIVQLRRRLELSQVRGTNLIRIAFTSPDPSEAAALANGVATSYRNFSANKAKQEARRRRDFIAQQLDQVADS